MFKDMFSLEEWHFLFGASLGYFFGVVVALIHGVVWALISIPMVPIIYILLWGVLLNRDR